MKQLHQNLQNNNGENITNPKEIADLLANTFAANSSDNNHNEEFKKIKNNYTTQDSNVNEDCSSSLNSEILEEEVRATLAKCKNSSPGPDNVHNIFLKNLPNRAIQILTEFYNFIWINGVYPKIWSEATIIPIPKPGKDKSQPMNYRPIALTCTMCKVFEKILNKRLKNHLKLTNQLSIHQSGFRANKSTYDHLIAPEKYICEAFIKNLHVLVVSLDMKKAYELIWKERIINIMYNKNIKGRMLKFITNFLDNRKIQVKVNNQISSKIDIENGIPQG